MSGRPCGDTIGEGYCALVTQGGRDPASVLACFDELGAAVFGSLCHLTAGDAAAAQLLLIRTFTHDLPAKSSGYDSAHSLDRRSVIVAAHHCYLHDPQAAALGSGPVAALSPTERVVLNLEVAERMRSPEINFAVRMAENDADYVAEAARRRLDADTFGRPIADVFAACEVWFDDAMRTHCRAEIEHALAFAPPPTDADGIVVQAARSRRLTIGGSIAATIVAAIALGAWLAPSNERSGTNVADLAPTSTTATPSSAVSKKDPSELPDPTETTVGAASSGAAVSMTDPGFILNPPPDGFVVSSAASDGRMLQEAAWLDVWSTPGATRNEGRWFSVRASIDSAYPVLANATREVVDGHITLSTVDPTGVSSVVERVDGVTLEFQSFGLAPDDIRRLVLATALTGDGAIERTDRLDEVTRRMELVWSGPTYDGAGPPGLIGHRSHAAYSTPDGSQQIDVVTSEQIPNDIDVSRLLTPGPAPYTLGSARMVVLSDVGALVGEVPARLPTSETAVKPPQLFAQWHSGSHTVTVIGRLPVEQLIQIARSAHPASESQWATMTSAVPIEPAGPASYFYDLTVLGQNVTEHGESWAVSLLDADCTMITTQKQTPGNPDVNEPVIFGGDASFCVTVDPTQPLLEYAAFDATLLAVLFDSPPTATALRVTVGDQPPVDVPIIASTKPAMFGAAFAFSEVAPYTAVLVDATGAVVQELTPVPAPEAAA